MVDSQQNLSILLIKYSLCKTHQVSGAEPGSDPSYPGISWLQEPDKNIMESTIHARDFIFHLSPLLHAAYGRSLFGRLFSIAAKPVCS